MRRARAPRSRGASRIESSRYGLGRNPHKGLAVFAFNGYVARLSRDSYHASLRYVAPVHVEGPTA